jgi:hypothetical protein
VKSGEHAAIGGTVSVVATVVLFEGVATPTLVAVVGYGLLLSVFVDLDHFLLARAEIGDWRHLELAVRNPRVGLIEQELVFEDVEDVLEPRRLLSHHLVGGVVVGVLVVVGLPTLAVFSAVVLYVHVLCDYLRDLHIA